MQMDEPRRKERATAAGRLLKDCEQRANNIETPYSKIKRKGLKQELNR